MIRRLTPLLFASYLAASTGRYVTKDKKSFTQNELRPYRQTMYVLYGIVTAVGFIWIAASVLLDTFARPRSPTDPSALSSAEGPPLDRAVCAERVRSLLFGLGDTTHQLLDLPHKERKPQISKSWESFQAKWQLEWQDVRTRCGFDRQAPSGSVAQSRMAQVHRDLPAMQHKYESLLARFEEQQAAELARMHTALDQTETALRQRADSDAP